MVYRPRVEEWLQLGEAVVLADKVESFPGLEAVEDRFHRLHVFAQLWHR